MLPFLPLKQEPAALGPKSGWAGDMHPCRATAIHGNKPTLRASGSRLRPCPGLHADEDEDGRPERLGLGKAPAQSLSL